jgi:predicted DCC family thiol-disulfide oxidoreductase YuxK
MMERRPFITVLYDGECPLCKREALAMRKLDRGRGILAVEDAADPDFDPAKYGLTLAEVMGVIHGVMADGTVVRELEVFRRAYGAVGWGWLWAPTGWPVVKPIFDRLYLPQHEGVRDGAVPTAGLGARVKFSPVGGSSPAAIRN